MNKNTHLQGISDSRTVARPAVAALFDEVFERIALPKEPETSSSEVRSSEAKRLGSSARASHRSVKEIFKGNFLESSDSA